MRMMARNGLTRCRNVPKHHYAGAPRQLRRRYRGWQRPARVALNSQTPTRQPRNRQQDKKTVNGNVKELLTRAYARQFYPLNACAPTGRCSRIRILVAAVPLGPAHATNDHTLVAAVSVMGRPVRDGPCPASRRHCSHSKDVHHSPFSERQDLLTERSVRCRLPTGARRKAPAWVQPRRALRTASPGRNQRKAAARRT